MNAATPPGARGRSIIPLVCRFLHSSLAVLSECRRILMYSYSFAFYIRPGQDQRVFQHNQASQSHITIAPPFFKPAQNLDLRCSLISDPGTLGAGAKTRLHTPKAVTYHGQPHYCRFMIGHSLGRMESRIKKFTPRCIYRPISMPMLRSCRDFSSETSKRQKGRGRQACWPNGRHSWTSQGTWRVLRVGCPWLALT